MKKRKNRDIQVVASGFQCRVCTQMVEGARPRSGMCSRCSYTRMSDEIIQLKQKRGPYYNKWRIGILRGVESAKSNDAKRD